MAPDAAAVLKPAVVLKPPVSNRDLRRNGAEESSSGSDEDSSIAEPCSPLHFTDIGATNRLLSHDLSRHVTDEVFNAASHLMGGMLALLGAAALITRASTHGDPWAIVAFSIYGASLNFLLWASFFHHALRGSQTLMSVLRKLDYVAIYFLIPGTMTPVIFICMHDRWDGWVFFGASWGLAIVGVVFQTACRGPLELPSWASMTMYITLGWFGGFLAPAALQCVGVSGVVLMALGGLAYTGGGVIHHMQCPNPWPGKFGFHEIWHVFVLLGAGFHFALIYFYMSPARG